MKRGFVLMLLVALAGVSMAVMAYQNPPSFDKDFITWVKAEIKAGKTADQAVMDYKFPDKYIAAGYTAPTAGRGGPGNNIRIAYMELGKK